MDQSNYDLGRMDDLQRNMQRIYLTGRQDQVASIYVSSHGTEQHRETTAAAHCRACSGCGVSGAAVKLQVGQYTVELTYDWVGQEFFDCSTFGAARKLLVHRTAALEVGKERVVRLQSSASRESSLGLWSIGWYGTG